MVSKFQKYICTHVANKGLIPALISFLCWGLDSGFGLARQVLYHLSSASPAFSERLCLGQRNVTFSKTSKHLVSNFPYFHSRRLYM
jgi:hypothetical protein